jgi:hypothetical protein
MSVEELSAWQYVHEYVGLKVRGRPPKVKYVDKWWLSGRFTAIGRYRVYIGFWKWIIWDKVTLWSDARYPWANMVHEFAHCVSRRNGLGLTELQVEEVEQQAIGDK